MSNAPNWDFYEVFIASPLGLEKERDAVERSLLKWRGGEILQVVLLPRRWEQLSGQLDIEVQKQINRVQVEKADILIAFFDGRKGSGGTVREIELFLSHGKGRGALVYFSSASRVDPALKELQEQLQNVGLVKEFTDLKDLTKKVQKDITLCIQNLEPVGSWQRLKHAVAEINNIAPYPLAQLLTNQMLRKPADQMENVQNHVRHFWRQGLGGYVTEVHHRLEREKKTDTKVFAICGEKGLGDYNQLNAYFQKFYEFAAAAIPKIVEANVIRVFVEKKGGRHTKAVLKVIKDHRSARGVIALTIPAKQRRTVNSDFPGLCEALDVGFGVVVFVRENKPNVAIVHQGKADRLTYAVFKQKMVVPHLITLTHTLYKLSSEYKSDGQLQRQIEEMFEKNGERQ